MKIFFSDGRLGNQIFQYVFLKTIQEKNERLIIIGFNDLKDVFEIDDIICITTKNRWINAFFQIIIKPILYLISNKKIISSIKVNHELVFEQYRRETTTYTKEIGFFKFICFIKLGFFQSEKFFNKCVTNKLIIKSNYLEIADKILKNIPENSRKIFIHIRRGDYKNYTVYGKTSLLPMNYYKKTN